MYFSPTASKLPVVLNVKLGEHWELPRPAASARRHILINQFTRLAISGDHLVAERQ
jgi:hypothetical protein